MDTKNIQIPEFGLLVNLSHFKSNQRDYKLESWKEGWQSAEDILTKRKYKKLDYDYNSGLMNMSNYIKKLENKGLVERRWYQFKDKKGRKHKERQYRIIHSKKNFEKLVMLFTLDNPHKGIVLPWKTDYWKVVNEKYPDIEREHVKTMESLIKLKKRDLAEEIRLVSAVKRRVKKIKNKSEVKRKN